MLERLLALLLLAIFGTVVLLVILRYVFNTTVVGGNEGALIAFVYTTAIGGALAVARREHIEIRYFVDLMPEGVQRVLGILQLALVAHRQLCDRLVFDRLDCQYGQLPDADIAATADRCATQRVYRQQSGLRLLPAWHFSCEGCPLAHTFMRGTPSRSRG